MLIWPKWIELVFLQHAMLETSHLMSALVQGSLHPDMRKSCETFLLNFIFQWLLNMKKYLC